MSSLLIHSNYKASRRRRCKVTECWEHGDFMAYSSSVNHQVNQNDFYNRFDSSKETWNSLKTFDYVFPSEHCQHYRPAGHL